MSVVYLGRQRGEWSPNRINKLVDTGIIYVIKLTRPSPPFMHTVINQKLDGGKASEQVCVHNNCGCVDLLLMLVPVWDVLCNSVDVISSGSHFGILAASVDQHLMCLINTY